MTLSEISVDSVRPLYGPVSGGTRVTISGQYLGPDTVTAVYVGPQRQQPEANGLVIVMCF